MLTARAETSDEVAGLRAGADDYVTKPFDADVLRQRVAGVLALQERLRRELEAEPRAASEEPSDERPAIEQEARTVIREHLTDSSFGVDDLADVMNVSRSTLYRRLRDAGDVTPSTLLTSVRMEEAQALLEAGESATQVAYAVGYERLSSFSRAFLRFAGRPPSVVEDV